jgi:hypothetical protein
MQLLSSQQVTARVALPSLGAADRAQPVEPAQLVQVAAVTRELWKSSYLVRLCCFLFTSRPPEPLRKTQTMRGHAYTVKE